jgi:hypothetical protein
MVAFTKAMQALFDGVTPLGRGTAQVISSGDAVRPASSSSPRRVLIFQASLVAESGVHSNASG